MSAVAILLLLTAVFSIAWAGAVAGVRRELIRRDRAMAAHARETDAKLTEAMGAFQRRLFGEGRDG